MKIRKVPLSQIVPYENNPRHNEDAVNAVAESIRQCGYRAKIIVDENMVIIAGHTRFQALQKLGWKEAEVQIENDMPEEIKRKYRLLDNKTNELASWDFEKLEEELNGLDFHDFDFGFNPTGIHKDYIEDYFDRGVEAKEKAPVLGLKVICGTEEQLYELKTQLEEQGFKPELL